MRLTVVGSGDAFGTGGRLQTCFHVARPGGDFLIDCGATTLIGFQKLALDPNDVSLIFISHLHGDHFAGLVWWMLHAAYVGKRTAPLTVVGPPGLEARFRTASEALFPSAEPRELNFDLRFGEYDRNGSALFGDVAVEVCEVRHPCNAPPFALRLSVDDKVIAFSGDTEWVDGLVDISRDADLFICECYAHITKTPYHMSWGELQTRVDDITAKKIMLTHMNASMLAHGHEVSHPRVILGADGLIVDV